MWLEPLINELSIVDKSANLVKFPIYSEFGWAQREYLAVVERAYERGEPVRLICLKARQLGLSTLTAALFFWWGFIHENTSALIVAHENKATASIFEKIRLFWESFEARGQFTLERSTLHKLKWKETRSSVDVASARNVGSGVGQTIHACHLSEFALYPNPDDLMTGLRQTIPNLGKTIIVIESTARGVGNLFHDLWLDATAGESDLHPLFFPWWMHYEYRMPTKLTFKDLDDEEKRYLRIFTKIGNPEVDYLTLPPVVGEPEALEALEWRRSYAIPSLAHHDVDKFMQEYPATPTEAFLSTGRNVFPLKALDACYEPKRGVQGFINRSPDGTVRFVPEPSGPLTLFKKPCERRNPDLYFIGADPSRTTSGDPACMQVINRRTHEQVAVWRGWADPYRFAHEMMALGKYFHGAELCCEIEGGGHGTIGAIMEAGYPRVWQDRRPDRMPGKVLNAFGWQTNYNRKHWAIGHLIWLLGERSITVHDRRTYAEMRDYVALPSGDLGNGNGSDHDDTVMALAIAVTASSTVGPYISPLENPVRTPLDLYGNG